MKWAMYYSELPHPQMMTMLAKQKSNREAHFVDGGQKSEII